MCFCRRGDVLLEDDGSDAGGCRCGCCKLLVMEADEDSSDMTALTGWLMLATWVEKYSTNYTRINNTIYTRLFPQDMIQDIYILHWNRIYKLIGVK